MIDMSEENTQEFKELAAPIRDNYDAHIVIALKTDANGEPLGPPAMVYKGSLILLAQMLMFTHGHISMAALEKTEEEEENDEREA